MGCLKQISIKDMLTEEMERSHPMVVFGIEISDFVFEKFDESEGRKSHKEMLDTPFFETFNHICSLVDDLPVHITALFHEVGDKIDELGFKLFELIIRNLFSFFSIRSIFPLHPNPFLESLFSTFCEILHKI